MVLDFTNLRSLSVGLSEPPSCATPRLLIPAQDQPRQRRHGTYTGKVNGDERGKPRLVLAGPTTAR